MLRILILTMILSLSGCAAFARIEQTAQKVVADYCKTPAYDREVLRMQFNNAVRPNAIAVTCFDDTVAPATLKLPSQ